MIKKSTILSLLLCSALAAAAQDAPSLTLDRATVAAGQRTTLTLNVNTAQRGFMRVVNITVPRGVNVTEENTTVNVIGRGAVPLGRLSSQYMGRHGDAYSLKSVGSATIHKNSDGSTQIVLQNIDLRVDNGIDLQLVFTDVQFDDTGDRQFTAFYKPQLLAADQQLSSSLRGKAFNASTDKSATGMLTLRAVSAADYVAPPKGDYTRRRNAYTEFGIVADATNDQSAKINAAIQTLAAEGGGILYFPAADKAVKTGTVTLASNVWIEIAHGAQLNMTAGSYPVEPTWWVDDDTDAGNKCYNVPDNYLTKQDVGHSFFRNCMFFGQRVHNVRIFGNGRLSGNGNLKHDNNSSLTAADKMFVFKLCHDIEVGGYSNGKDLWYDDSQNNINAHPFYLNTDNSRDANLDNMLEIDRAGHFVLLATGTDTLRVHDIYYGRNTNYPSQNGDTRDVFDFMECNEVDVTNIYAKYCGDDVVKFGSECSLGFTRKGRGFRVRNIIGNTNCNVFQIGSETADDLRDFYVDNLFVLGSNKAGFSISTNDGATVANIYLNHGKTGRVHSRSQMRRTRSPFFFSISNRGRILGCQAEEYKFTERQKDGDQTRQELLCTNIPIGRVDSIYLRGVDAREIFAGAQSDKFPSYGNQAESTVIIAGYKYPDRERIISGDYSHLPLVKTGWIRHITFDDIHLTLKGGHPASDSLQICPELGIGMFNIRNFNTQPSYAYWGRHVQAVSFQNCTNTCERPDGRPAIKLEDVLDETAEAAFLRLQPSEPALCPTSTFDLLGRPLRSPVAGIFIRHGKKFQLP